MVRPQREADPGRATPSSSTRRRRRPRQRSRRRTAPSSSRRRSPREYRDNSISASNGERQLTTQQRLCIRQAPGRSWWRPPRPCSREAGRWRARSFGVSRASMIDDRSALGLQEAQSVRECGDARSRPSLPNQVRHGGKGLGQATTRSKVRRSGAWRARQSPVCSLTMERVACAHLAAWKGRVVSGTTFRSRGAVCIDSCTVAGSRAA